MVQSWKLLSVLSIHVASASLAHMTSTSIWGGLEDPVCAGENRPPPPTALASAEAKRGERAGGSGWVEARNGAEVEGGMAGAGTVRGEGRMGLGAQRVWWRRQAGGGGQEGQRRFSYEMGGKRKKRGAWLSAEGESINLGVVKDGQLTRGERNNDDAVGDQSNRSKVK